MDFATREQFLYKYIGFLTTILNGTLIRFKLY